MDTVPVRRPKSWMREREETRAKHIHKPKEATDTEVWELPRRRGMNTGICNKNIVNFKNRTFTSSQHFGNKLNGRNKSNHETFFGTVQSVVYSGIKNQKGRTSFRKSNLLNFVRTRVAIPNISYNKCASQNFLNESELTRVQTSKRDCDGIDVPHFFVNSSLKRKGGCSETNTDHLGRKDSESLVTSNILDAVILDTGVETKLTETRIAIVHDASNYQSSTCLENVNVLLAEVEHVVGEDLCCDTSMADTGYLEISEVMELEGVRNRSVSCHQRFRNHCSELSHVLQPFRENAVRCVQSTPKLSSPGENLKRNLVEVGVLDAYLDKKIDVNGSFGDVPNDCKSNIPFENTNKDCVLSSNNPTIHHNGECDYVHKYLLSNGLIGYIVSRDRLIETFTVAPKTVTSAENIESTVSEDDRQDMMTYFSEPQQRIFIKSKLRSINYNAATLRPYDGYFSTLDSSLKKNTAFVRKLKTFTSSQLDSLLKDMASLNLTKYVSEVAAALVECKLKMSDVWAAVQISNIFHQTYSDFSTYLLENWQKALSIKKEEQISNPSKLRVDLRFYAELVSVGVFTRKEGLSLIGNVLTLLTCLDKEDHYNIKILLSFCRHCGDEYAGLIPRKVKLLSEKYNIPVPQYKLLPEEKQHNVKALFKDYYNSLCNHLLKEHGKLQEFSKQNRRILHTKGELGLERKDRLEAAQASFNQIATGTQLFAEALDEDIPILPEDESLKFEGIIFCGNSEFEEGNQDLYLWDDEESRYFYECFPDVKQLVPAIQIKAPEPEKQVSEETLDLEFEEDICGETTNEEDILLVELEEEEPECTGNTSNKVLLESFLSALPNCITKELIDKAAVEFVTSFNTKHNRRKLVKALFTVPRIRLDLLPFYARFVATLYPIASDVAVDLAQMLKRNFKYHVHKKDQMNIESKVKVVRFIGELVKFHMYSKFEGLYCLKVLVQDFTHHHIEMCCNFLESCGRFFFRHPDCHPRMKVYLDQIMRKKAVVALDPRYVTMIENVYYYVNPPEETMFIVKERLDEEEFIRMLLYQKLEKLNVEEILCLMQKLNWDEPGIASYAVKCLSRPFKVKYYNIRYMASLLAGLAIDHEIEGTQVIDGVLEDIQLGMEVNLPEYNQRRLAMVKYLGELYNYRLVENSNIFRVLHSLITFDVTYNHAVDSLLDPPDSLFRIRLVCTLLDTCGEYFSSGLSRRKLDLYLVCFQYYYWFKFSHPFWHDNSFPCTIKYMFQDTVTSLRPNVHLFTTLSEAEDAVGKLCKDSISNIESQYCEFEISTVDPNADKLDELGDESDESKTSEIGQINLDVTPKSSDEVSNEMAPSSPSKCSSSSDVDKEEDSDSCMGYQGRGVQMEGKCCIKSTFYNCTINTQEEVNENNMDDDLVPSSNHVECPEDEDFLTAFNRMVSDNLRDRMHEIVKPHNLDISVPLHIKSKVKQPYMQLRNEDSNSSLDFLLILRKGNKQQFKNLVVPINSEIALNLINHKEAERVEKECMKRLTLNISDRLEEEDYQEMLAQAQRPATVNFNRERKHKYQHPKGAPDADRIFSPQKVR